MTLDKALEIAKLSVSARAKAKYTDEDLRQAVTRLRTTVGSTRRAVEARWGSTTPAPIYRALEDRLAELSFSKLPAKSMTHNQLTAMIAAYKPFYLKDDGTPTDTRTAKGYKQYLKRVEESTGIAGYSTWDESQRKDYWDLVKKLEEIDSDLFSSINGRVSKGKASYEHWTSGTTYKFVEEIRMNNPDMTPEQILDELNALYSMYKQSIAEPMPDFK